MFCITEEFPAFGDVFVRERDTYLCHSLQVAASQGCSVVGIVGIGHTKGIVDNWGKVDSAQIAKILYVPNASMKMRCLKFSFKYGSIFLLGYGVFRLIRLSTRNLFIH